MEEGTVKINENEEKTRKEEIYTKVVRAGKRTYFFDVKATRKDDYYLTITESKKRTGKEGKTFYEKHKIFLYKEDFEKFTEGLKDVVNFINNGKTTKHEEVRSEKNNAGEANTEELSAGKFTSVSFEDLG
ncbi:MAG TPA: DUF3276 family protein [Bacteroidales bacterium]|nr:DUF3276 family protein [Bacteroidales bacterium]HOK74647.1 DUF3276 family protein [Bacteroidales bacterium]HOM41680.1 DUF3276 family protein [Bacteroidales bacterium]HPP93418.1 DUF3276 family protein [Bacteroidales bacterium]